jgi:tetratricopeptide (TPR) repeat protein
MNKRYHFFIEFIIAGLLIFGSAQLLIAQSEDLKQYSLRLNEDAAALATKAQFKEAEVVFRKALEADEGNTTAAYNLAGMLIQNKKYPEAIGLLKKYQKVQPDNLDLTVRLGDAYFSNKKPQEALPFYEAAFEAQPTYPDLANKLGTVYTLLNRLEDAEKVLEAAIKRTPKDAKVLANLSAVQLTRGKAKESLNNAKRAIAISPSGDAYVTLGSAHESLGNTEAALAAYHKAKELGDTSKDLDRAIEGLKEE